MNRLAVRDDEGSTSFPPMADPQAPDDSPRSSGASFLGKILLARERSLSSIASIHLQTKRVPELKVSRCDDWRDGKVKLKTIAFSLDFGMEAELVTSLTPEDHVIVNPPVAVANGDEIKQAPTKVPAAKGRTRLIFCGG